jgi:O-acetylserine/cysteine efflux transporter
MSPSERLPSRHLLLALAVVAIWGSNFVVIKLALGALPPLLFATLRFAFALLPAVFFLPRPAVPWGNLAAYGLLIGVGQFGVLYLAMRAQISPGLASLVVQTQVFFTLLLAMRVARERVLPYQWAGLLLAATGIAVIAAHTDGSTTVTGLLMVLGAAFSWACGNLVGKRAGRVNMLAYMVWTSLFAVPPLLLLSLLVEGPAAIAAGLGAAGWATWAAVLWQALGNTLFGYGVWGWLLARHPAASVVPLALLVPVFGMGSAALFMGEALPAWKLGAAALVLSGLALNLLWPRLRPQRGAAA